MKSLTLFPLASILSLTSAAFAQAPAAAPAPAAPTPVAEPAAPAPAAPAPAPAGAAASEPAPAVAPVEAPVAPPVAPAQASDRVLVAKDGFFQPSINLQAWAWAEHLGNSRTADNAWTSTFRIRRAEIKAKGEVIPKTLAYAVMIDPAKLLDLKNGPTNVTDASGNTVGTASVLQTQPNGSTSILQDVELTYLTDYADVSIGQFKIPISLEGFGSATKLYFPERSLIARKYGDKRDLGFKLEKKFEHFSYLLGVYNGSGQNNLDSNDQKDLALRLELYPVKDVTLALAGYTSVGDRNLPGTKDRIEGDLKVEKSGFLLQAEAIRGWDVVGTATAHDKVEGQGFYVLAGYTLFDSLQPVVRIGSIDPEVGKDEHGSTVIDPNDEITAYEFGVNYYAKKHNAKLQLAGSFFDPEQRVSKTTFDLILAAQVAF